MLRFIISLLVLFTWQQPVYAALPHLSTQVQFKHLNTDSGLSQNTVTSIAQDKEGYIWIGTNNGLNRFDGYDVKVYRLNSKETSSDVVNTIFYDNDRNLWIGTTKGFFRYESSEDVFRAFTIENNQTINVSAIDLSDDGILYISTKENGIFYYSKNDHASKILNNTDSTTIRKLDYSFINVLANENLRVIKSTSNNRILVGTNYNLYILNTKEKTANKIQLHRSNSLFRKENTTITSISFISDDRALVGTIDGLFDIVLYRNNTKHVYYISQATSSNRTDVINTILRTSDDQIWIGTKEGLLYSNKDLTDFKFIQSFNYKYALSDNDIMTLFEDRQKNLWVGTNTSGVDRFNINAMKFGLIFSTPKNKTCIKNNFVYNILLSSKNNLWISDYGNGLQKINLNTGSCDFYRQRNGNGNGNGISSNLISANSLFEDITGDIWHRNNNFKGLNRFNTKNEKFDIFHRHNSENQHINQISNQRLSSSLRKTIRSPTGELWMAFDGGGISKFDPKNETFINFTYKSESQNGIGSPYIFDLLSDSSHLWIATETAGLERLNFNTENIDNINKININNLPLPRTIYSISDDMNGNLWLGTKGEGLIKFNKDLLTWSQFSQRDGLPSNTIYTTLRDKSGMLWLTTNNGLSKFDPIKETFHNYYQVDGLQGNEFNVGSQYSEKFDLMLLAGPNGFNAFKPGDLTKKNYKPEVTITNFTIFNREENQLLDRIHNRVSLDYSQNIFSFHFSGLFFMHPEGLTYKYKIDNFDKEWRDTTYKNRVATYTNLDPGAYTFRVKAKTHQHVWSDEKTVNVTILPPFWLTWWAKALYIFLTISIPIALYLYRTSQLRRRNRHLEEQISNRTQQLFEEKNRVELLLNEKTIEFDNISHEFRTPLSIILGRADDRLAHSRSSSDRIAFKTIKKVADRLSIIVDDVIEIGKSNQLHIEKGKTLSSVSTLCIDICETMYDYAKQKNQKFKFDIEADIYQLCQPASIEKLFSNLIGNAIKYTQENGTIDIYLKKISKNYFRFSVKDNGPGIATEKHQLIFKRFYRVDNSSNIQGTGIGLSLVQAVVKNHNGEITLYSEVDQGSEFIVEMPLARIDNEQENNVHHFSHTPSSNRIAVAMAMNSDQDDVTRELVEINESNQANISEYQIDNTEKADVLIVEDNVELRALLVDQLSGFFNIRTAKNGMDGLNNAQLNVPQIIISDINMPHMDGYQLLDLLKNHSSTSHIPVILLTAKVDALSRIEGYKYHADAYIPKPYVLEELIAVIESKLKNRLLTQRYYIQQNPVDEFSHDASVDAYSIKSIENCKKLVEKRYQDPDLKVQDLVEVAHLSERQLSRKFQDILGMSPSEFINNYRLAKAKILIKQGYRISEVANSTGFSSANYLSRQYKKQYGVSPTQDR